MKKYILPLCLLCLYDFSTSIYAQDLSMYKWHIGELDLTIGETLKGEIKYNLERHWLEYRKDNVHRVFSSVNVTAFQIIDALTGEYRTFISLPISQSRRYKRKLFFELLSQGAVSLFCRDKVVTKVQVDNASSFPLKSNRFGINSYGNTTGDRIRRIRTVGYDYYYVGKKNQVSAFEPTEENIFELMSSRKQKIEKFIEDNNLDLSEKTDLTIIFNYYNDLREKL